MRYLTTILLTATFLTTGVTYVSAATIDDPTTKPGATATSFSAETQAKIKAFETLVSSSSHFNVSDAAKILFSPELFPFISWRSPKKNEEVVSQINRIIAVSFSKDFNRNNKLTASTLLAIKFPTFLESNEDPSYHKTEGIKKPTWLNELVDGTICWGGYCNVLSHYELTFTPELRLKLYLELLHQTNITPDSLGHILRTTTELTKMFMTEPQAALVKDAENFKALKVNSIPSESARYHYPELQYPSLAGIHTGTATQDEILRSLTWSYEILSNTLADFEQSLDNSMTTAVTSMNRILACFGTNAVDLFREIFERIATHSSTQPKDKFQSAARLVQAGGSSDTIVNVYTQLANDSTIDYRDRLFAAKILLETGSKETAITAYTQIKDTLENTAAPIKDKDIKFSRLIDVGIGLHRAGATELALGLLADQFKCVSDNIETLLTINTSNVITMVEILFNAGKFQDKDNAIPLIRWAVCHPMTCAFLPEVIILGAETAERMGDFTASREFLDHLQQVEEREEFKNRVDALNAKLSTAAAS